MKKRFRKWLYGKCPGFKGAFPYYGTKVYFPPHSHIFNLACEQGTYEHDIVQLLIRLIKPDSYFFDVGANIGLISVPILYQCRSNRVVSFEPSPNTLPYLQRTIATSLYRTRWVIVNKAVGAEIGETEFHVSAPQEGAFDGINDTKRGGFKKEIIVNMTTLDAEWELLGKPNVSVIKIDVEGAEINVLKGAVECITNQKPYIITEWNEYNFKSYGNIAEDLIKIANENDYSIYSIPRIIKINDGSDLHVQMIFSENFLLCPNKNK